MENKTVNSKVTIHPYTCTNSAFSDFPPGDNYILQGARSEVREKAVWDLVRVKNGSGVTIPLLILIWNNIPFTIEPITNATITVATSKDILKLIKD